jgi:hypothetical protein
VICGNETELQTRRTIAIVLVVVFFIFIWYLISIKPLLALFTASSNSEPNDLSVQQDVEIDSAQLQLKAARIDLDQPSSIGKFKSRIFNMNKEWKATLSKSR